MCRRWILVLFVTLAPGLSWAGAAFGADESLMGWWKFDGNAQDASDNERHGTLTGNPQYVAGVYREALDFDGDDYVSITGYKGITGAQAFSITAWAKQTAATTGTIVAWGQLANGLRVRFLIRNNGQLRLSTFNGNVGSNINLAMDEWHHVVVAKVQGQDEATLYADGQDVTSGSFTGLDIVADADVAIGWDPVSQGSNFTGVIDEVRLYDQVLTPEEVLQVMAGGGPGADIGRAKKPVPENEAIDVPRDAILGWTAGQFAATHDVYLGTTLEEVNSADRTDPLGVLLSQGQFEATYDLTDLDFAQTYYWRIDEVNAAPDDTIFKGEIWSFTTEPFAYAIDNVVATTNGVSDEGAGPENMVNRSGLNANDQHSVESSDMWAAVPPTDAPLTIQFDFDNLYKLHQMLVWNYNVALESLLGFGAREATIEYSADGADWTVLGDVELAQATGSDDYTANTTIDFEGTAARYVRLTVNSAYGTRDKAGLSEVRFLYIPVRARKPQPADAAADVAVAEATLSWRAGREAATHEVSLGTDPEALTLIDSVADSIVDPGSLNLGTTYYWRVDEVNDAEAISLWEGAVWNFATQKFIVVDDFESYTDDIEAGEAIFLTWVDGYEIDDNGSQVGYLDAPFAEQTIVHGGGQSMPLIYDNAGGVTLSEATRTFASVQDWSINGIRSLSLFLYGDAANSGRHLHLKINDAEVSYAYLADVLQRPQWVPWTIDLAATGADLSRVTSLSLGIEGAGAAGTIFVDDIRLYPQAVELVDPVPPADDDPNLAAHYEFEGNADDSTGNYPTGVVGEPGYATGKIGQAIVLDEIVDYIIHTFDQEEVWPAYSLSLWVQTDAFAQDQYSSVFNNNSSSDDFQIDTDGSDPGNYSYRGTSAAVFGPVSSDWVHLTVSCDGAKTDLYYNGLFVTSLEVADTRFGQIAIGINRGMANQFGGMVDDVRLYNRAISDAEAAGLAGLAGPIVRPFR